MDQRHLGRSGPAVSPLGYGAFKIGRNEQTKYGTHYELPDQPAVDRLLNGLLDLGINYFDTAPAYGLSEERLGKALGHRRHEFTLSTKVGELFEGGRSTYDFSSTAINHSVHRSLQRLQTEVLDVVFIHANQDDIAIIDHSDVVPTLIRLRDAGLIRQIGMSAKTPAGAMAALGWADVLMLEYHMEDRSMEPVITAAAESGVGVVVKKALSSGKLPAHDALRFVLSHPGVATVVVGTLNIEHMRDNLAACDALSK